MSLIAETILSSFGHVNDVSIIEFAESSDFCGLNLYPRQRVLLKLIWLEEMEGWEEDILTSWIRGDNDVIISPMIRERRDYLRSNGYPHFSETILVGGRRSSKSFIAGLSGAKKIFNVQMLGDPGRYFGIAPNKEIYFSCIAASLKQSKELQFADLVNAASHCVALRPYLFAINEEGFRIRTPSDAKYVEDLKKSGTTVGRDFSRLRAQPLAANAATIRGSTSIFQIFDEMAHMMEGTEGNQTATKCYDAGEPALAQFGRYGMTFLNSSPAAKIGKFFERHENAMTIDPDGRPAYPTIFTMQYPSWELYRGYEKDPRKRFKHALMVDPDTPDELILCDEDRVRRDRARLRERANPEEFSVEYRGQWAEVVDSYFNPVAVERMYRSHFEYKDESGTEIIVPVKLSQGGSYQYNYVAHLDPSSTTAGYGFSLGHVEYFPDENFPGRKVPHVVYDVVYRWNPNNFPGGTIDQLQVIAEIVEWCKLYRPAHLTHDQFNAGFVGQLLRQELRKAGITETRVWEDTGTNQKNWNKWEVMKTAANLGLLHVSPELQHAEWSKQELKFLQKKENGSTKRVVKQTTGPVQSKDVADTMRDVAYMLIGSTLGEMLDIDFQGQDLIGGSPGGYALGRKSGALGGLSNINEFYGGKMGGHMGNRGINPNRKRY